VGRLLADPRARIPKRRSDYTAKQAFYRLADELRDTILVARHTSFATVPGGVPSDGSVGAAPKRCPGWRGVCRGIRHSGMRVSQWGLTPTTYTCWLTGTLH